MSDLNISVEFVVTCMCGNDLDSGVTVERRSYAPRRAEGRHEIVVEPCARCLDKASAEGAEDQKVARDDEVETLKERITELESAIVR